MVTEDDCGTTNGIAMRALVEGGEVIESLRDRILGRVTGWSNVLHPGDGGAGQGGDARRGRGRRKVEGRPASTRSGAHAADLRHALRRLRQVLRPRPRPRRLVNVGEAVGVIARAVDRRAGHAADDAHVPHRWCGLACGGISSVEAKSDGIIGFNATMRYVTNGKGGWWSSPFGRV